MKNIIQIIYLLLSITICSYNLISAQQSETVNSKISKSVKAFDLTDVHLLDGPFKKAMELDGKYLIELDPDRLLSWFRKEAGLKPKGEVYGGWESEQLAGHTLGHYLSACSMMYASTGNKKLLQRINYIVNELDSCQISNNNGYVSAIPGGKKLFKEISERNIDLKRTSPFRLNGIWSPWYTMHKIFAGLLDAQKYCGNQKALRIAEKLGDWAYNTTKNLTREEFQKMLICEYGGMNETLADLYERTGEKKFLVLAEKFFDNKVLVPLEEEKDNLAGLHSNTQIPKLIGLTKLYKLTGNINYITAAKFFWKTVVEHHSYVIGGNSEDEHFGKRDNLSARLDSNTCETCNTYNMLKLTRELFELNPSVEYIDYYERALYNHILASQNPETGMMCYYVPLTPGEYKDYSSPFNSFWCCVGTGMENHSKYGRNIYFYNNDSVYVNLFIHSVLNWKEKGIKLTQQTNFPEEGNTKFIINCNNQTKFSLLIRIPKWTNKDMQVYVNGNKQKNDFNAGYFEINGNWEKGDVVEVILPMKLHLERMMDNKNKAAILYGPLVLAGKLGQENDPSVEDSNYVPELKIRGKEVNEWIKPVNGKANLFQTIDSGIPGDIILYPFYKAYNFRYSVYWDILK